MTNEYAHEYTQIELEILSMLSENGKKLFDDMYNSKALGAANNIKSIGLIYQDIASNTDLRNISADELKRRIKLVNDYYIEKRGKSSYAIITGIKIMTGFLDDCQDDVNHICEKLKDAYNCYLADSESRTEKISLYAWERLKNVKSILVFDYSSTVNLMMKTAIQHNLVLDVYVPESRILDGGHQFLRNGVSMGHRMHYIPDVSMSKFILMVDACFIGAETLYPNGTVFNTAGSDLVGLLCNFFDKPLYVPTAMIKLDPKGFDGFMKAEHIGSAGKFFGLQLEDELAKSIKIECVGLVKIDSKYITAFITEYGIIKPAELENTARQYMREIGEAL